QGLAHRPICPFRPDAWATGTSTLSLHDALPISQAEAGRLEARTWTGVLIALGAAVGLALLVALENARLYAEAQRYIRQLLDQSRDRKSTRLNSSHVSISYAVFCSKKK